MAGAPKPWPRNAAKPLVSIARATAACVVAEENADPQALWNPMSDCPATVASITRQTQISQEAPYIICDA
jgi:hypothetical protein